MSDDELLSHIEHLERQAVGYFTGEVQAEQTKAMDYYLGKPFGTEEEGRSSVVSTDVWDVVEGMTPLIIKPFLASDDVVTFNPAGPEDEEAAKQESEYINWVATQKNDNFTELVNWVKTGLLQKNGVVKYWWEVSKRSTVERYFGLSDDQMAMLAQDAGVEIIEHTESAAPDGMPVHDVTLRTTEEQGTAKYCVIPPEEFLIGRDATSPNPKAATFVQHRSMVSIGRLRAMGYDIDDDISDGGSYDPLMAGTYQARRSEEEQSNRSDEGADASAREVLYRETFLLVDADGDGMPELRKVCAVGHLILANEETEEIPFSGWTPYQQAFKFYGRCPADEAIEIQAIKSTLWRQNLDNIYSINNNRVFANESVNIDDLIDNQIAGVVRVNGMGSVQQSVMPAQITPIGAVIHPMIEYLDAAKENRTGFSRYNQGSADLGNQKTLGEVQIVSEQSGQRVELISRQFANGLADLMRGLHGLCRRHATKSETVRLRNKWVEVDPRGWKTRADMSISVGLGTSDQRMKMQGSQLLLQTQMNLAPMGVVQPEHFLKAASRLAEAVGFKNAEEFFGMKQQAGLPPQVQQALQQAQMELQQLQSENQQLKSGIAAKQIDAQAKVQTETIKAQAASQLQSAQQQFTAYVENLRDDQKRDAEELRAWLAMQLQRMQPPPQLAAEVSGDMSEGGDGQA